MCLGTHGRKRLGLSQGSVVGSEPCVIGKDPRFPAPPHEDIIDLPFSISWFHRDEMCVRPGQ